MQSSRASKGFVGASEEEQRREKEYEARQGRRRVGRGNRFLIRARVSESKQICAATGPLVRPADAMPGDARDSISVTSRAADRRRRLAKRARDAARAAR